jgi:hypothetical protein
LEIQAKFDELIEIWKPINNFINYEVSNLGNVKNTLTNKLLKPLPSGSNKMYLSVCLYKNKKPNLFYVHRLVLENFIEKCPENLQCAHLDGNSKNNKLENLKWVTPLENTRHKYIHKTIKYREFHANHKLKNKDITRIINLFISGESTKNISKKYGVDPTSINHLFTTKKTFLTSCPVVTNLYKLRVKKNKKITALKNSGFIYGN